ncbi:MAG: DNA-processing protein DprA [Woeseiaceae bacterium]|nr:DNA-processing protein DprA [Woeseiaceae bacterium]
MQEQQSAIIVASLARLRAGQLNNLVARFGDLASALGQSAARLTDAGLTEQQADRIRAPEASAVAATMDWLQTEGHTLLVLGDESYPQLLAGIDDPPPFLYVNGGVDALHLPSLAIVGSRNPTKGGERNASDFAEHLAGNGFVVVSGLAQGIDTAAHRGALASGGSTVACLGHGIDRIYPAANRDLAHSIAAQGALVSEFPLGTAPDKRHFPQRNRLISGLSLGTLVVEAAKRSGSLITARLAGEQGREVFAIPGSIHNALSRGCHQLIRSGAKLVESADDIVAELGHWISHLRQPETEVETSVTEDLNDEQKDLLNIMGHDPVSIDSLVEGSGLTIDQLSSMLLILELEGRVEKLPGGQYATLHRPDSAERPSNTK